MKITTDICKAAIVQYLLNHPGLVCAQFGEKLDETPAHKVSNWKRRSKQYADKYTLQRLRAQKLTERMFECVPFEDQLRAYVYDDGTSIVHVLVQGE